MLVIQNKNNKVGSNIVWLGVVQIANYVMPLITVPIVSRVIGPEKFGVINFATAFVAYFSLVISYGFNLTATRRLAVDPNDREKRNQIFSEVFNAQVLLLLLTTIIFLICLLFIPQLRQEWVISVFTYFTCFSTLLTQNWLFQAMQDLSKVAILNFVSKFLFMLAILVVIHEQSDYIWYALALSGSQVLVAMFSFIWSFKKYDLTLHKIDILSSLQLLRQEKTYFFSLVVINLYTTTNIVLLGILDDATDVGYYSAGLKLTTIIQTILILPFRQSFFPYMSKEINKDVERGVIIAQKILPLIFFPTLILCLGTFFFSKFFIYTLYGNAFAPSIIVLQILSFLPLIIALSNIWGIIVMMNLKLDKIYFNITLFCAILSIALNLIIIPVWSYIGAAVVLVLTQFLGMLLIFLYLHRMNIRLIDFTYFNFRYMTQMLQSHFKKG